MGLGGIDVAIGGGPVFWKYLAVLAGGIAVSAIGLSAAYHYDLEWLRVLSITAPVALVGLAVTLLKRRQQRGGRPRAPGVTEGR